MSGVLFHDPLPVSLEAASVPRTLADGEYLFEQGDPASAIYKIESGRLRLIRRTLDDHLVVLHTARAGELFAEAALFSEVYHCDAVAAVPSRIRAYPKAALIAALRSEPALSELSWRAWPARSRISAHEWSCAISARRGSGCFSISGSAPGPTGERSRSRVNFRT